MKVFKKARNEESEKKIKKNHLNITQTDTQTLKWGMGESNFLISKESRRGTATLYF